MEGLRGFTVSAGQEGTMAILLVEMVRAMTTCTSTYKSYFGSSHRGAVVNESN